MGVAGLWDIIRPAGKQRSLTHLAVVDGFQANPDGKRGYRIGIDASIWFYHAAYGKEGENPELRTLFFRLTRLMNKPFLPLFVFDGPKRPAIKRKKRIKGTDHWLTTGMKNMIDAFGFEWRTAPGEAEAELAYLNRIGVIDAVLSDDVDNFLFGATTLIRNTSKTLSGNKSNPVKNSAGKEDDNHTMMYRSSDILTHQDITLTHGGLILIGLLSGGDYHDGLEGCGTSTAHALAKCGFGDTLFDAALTLDSEDALPAFLDKWREDLKQELRTNSQGKNTRKSVALAKKVPDEFPDIQVLLSYTNPVTSESLGKSKRAVEIDWDREPDLGKIAGLCELYFEWGVKDIIIKRFRTVLWPSAVLRILRRGALNIDARHGGRPSTPTRTGSRLLDIGVTGTPSKMINKHFSSSNEEDDDFRLIVKIHSARTHPSTDQLPELRVEIAPAQLVRLSAAGVKGIRPDIVDEEDMEEDEDEDGEGGGGKGKKEPADPSSNLRVWMPAVMVRFVEPGVVSEWEAVVEKRLARKNGTGTGGKTRVKSATTSGKGKRAAAIREESEEESDSLPTFAPPAVKPKLKRTTSRKAAVAQEDSAGEEFDFGKDAPAAKPKPKLKRTASKKAAATGDDEPEKVFDFAGPASAVVPPPNPTLKRTVSKKADAVREEDQPEMMFDLTGPLSVFVPVPPKPKLATTATVGNSVALREEVAKLFDFTEGAGPSKPKRAVAPVVREERWDVPAPRGVKAVFPTTKRATVPKPKAKPKPRTHFSPDVEDRMPLYDGSDDSTFFEDPADVLQRLISKDKARPGPSRLSVPSSPPARAFQRTISVVRKPSPFRPGVIHVLDDSEEEDEPGPSRVMSRTQSAPTGSYKALKHSHPPLPQVRQEPSLLEISSDSDDDAPAHARSFTKSKSSTLAVSSAKSPFPKSKSSTAATQSTHNRTEDFLPASFEDEDMDFGLAPFDMEDAMEVYTSPAKRVAASSDEDMKSPRKDQSHQSARSRPRATSPSPMRKRIGCVKSGIVIDISSDISLGSPPPPSRTRVRALPPEMQKEPGGSLLTTLEAVRLRRREREAAEAAAAMKVVPEEEEEEELSIIDLT